MKAFIIRIEQENFCKFVIFAQKNFLKMNFAPINFPKVYSNSFENNISNKWFVQLEDWTEPISGNIEKPLQVGIRIFSNFDIVTVNQDRFKFFEIKN